MHDISLLPPSPTLSPNELQELIDRLQRERQLLADERAQFRQEQANLRQYWRRRLRSEWQKLELDAARLEEERQTLQRQQQQVAAQEELHRRQLDVAWQQLRAEQHAWRQDCLRREAELVARFQTLGHDQARLESAQADWERRWHELHHSQQRQQAELAGVESRIQHLRTVLARLQTERRQAEENLTPTVVTLPRTLPAGVTEAAEADRLQNLLFDLKDEGDRLARFHDSLLKLREAWLQEWERAEAALAEREADLQQQEQVLKERHQVLRDWMLQLHRQREELQQRTQQVLFSESRLLRQRSELQCERGRLLALLRARAAAARSRVRFALAMREQAVDLSLEYAARQHHLAEREQDLARQTLDQQRRLERRQSWLDERERELAAKELALVHAEQQLLARDPDPEAAAAELERRFQHLLWLAQRPLRGLEQREAELADLHDQLEAFRHRLLTEEQQLARERAELEARFAAQARRRLLWDVSRTRVRQEVTSLRLENQRLREHIEELREQLERLALVLLETPPTQPGATLALAAAA